MAAGDMEDIDALLEEPYLKDGVVIKSEDAAVSNGVEKSGDKKSSKDNSKKRSRSRSRDRKRSSDDRKKSSSRRSRSKDREKERSSRRGGSRDRDRRRSRSPRRRSSRERRSSPPRERRPARSPPPRRRTPTPPRSGRIPGPERRDVMPFTPRFSPPRDYAKIEDMTPEDRDARTVFCMQLHRTCRPRDLEEFFSAVGKVRDVRIITDSKTKRSKGIAYVEFYDLEAVPLALGLNGQRLLGAPMIIQPTQAEKNRIASAFIAQSFGQGPPAGPLKLYVGSLHFNITEEMLRGIFEPFGRIDSIELMTEESGRSRGYGFITFNNQEDAKKAMEQLNGFELAGRAMKVGHVTDHVPSTQQQSLGDEDMSDRQGVEMGSAARVQLMARLAEGTGMKLPSSAQQLLQAQPPSAPATTPSIATQCFMLSNMFDPSSESGDDWDADIRDDVIDECNKHGGCQHVFVDKGSPDGNVYVKCPSVQIAVSSVQSLHGRWFAGKVITANYVPVVDYHRLFPSAAQAMALLQSSSFRAA